MHNSLLNIQNELEKARERLKDVEETIKKSIGRDINNTQTLRPGFKRTARHLETTQDGVKDVQRPRFESGIKNRLGDSPWNAGGGPQTGHDFRGLRNNRNDRFRAGGGNTDERISAKKRLGEQTAVTVFSRLSGPPKDDDDEEKETVKITSQVIVQDTPSRKEVLAAQAGDNVCRARNRRMFGALIGHIQKFRQEENRLKEKERKKAEIEKKVEEAALREKEELKKKRQELFTSRRQQQQEIRQLEYKLMRMKQLTDWESTRKHLVNFIQTTATPKIFYLPKIHNEKSKKLLDESGEKIIKMIEEKRAEVERSINDHGKRSWKNNEQSTTNKAKQKLISVGGRGVGVDDDDDDDNINEDMTSMGRTVEAAELADDYDEEEEEELVEERENEVEMIEEIETGGGDGSGGRGMKNISSEMQPLHENEIEENDNKQVLHDEDRNNEETEVNNANWADEMITQGLVNNETEQAILPAQDEEGLAEEEKQRNVVERLINDFGDNESISDKENLLDIQPPPDDPPSNLPISTDHPQPTAF